MSLNFLADPVRRLARLVSWSRGVKAASIGVVTMLAASCNDWTSNGLLLMPSKGEPPLADGLYRNINNDNAFDVTLRHVRDGWYDVTISLDEDSPDADSLDAEPIPMLLEEIDRNTLAVASISGPECMIGGDACEVNYDIVLLAGPDRFVHYDLYCSSIGLEPNDETRAALAHGATQVINGEDTDCRFTDRESLLAALREAARVVEEGSEYRRAS